MKTSRVAVVTGANRGIGFSIVKLVCQGFDGVVYLTCRNQDSGNAAVAQLQRMGLSPKFHQLDIDDPESIQRLRDHLQSSYSGLDVLVNNAATKFATNSKVPFGLQAERMIQTNFFSTLDVCDGLLPILRPHARVVNVSSSAGMLRRIPGEHIRKEFSSADLTIERLCSLMRRFVADAQTGTHLEKGWDNPYTVSKVGLTALTRLQQRQFDADIERSDLIVNAVHPGRVPTEMSEYTGCMTADEGAAAPTYLALLPPNVEQPKGQFMWSDCRVIPWDATDSP